MADCLIEVLGGMLYTDQRDESRKLLPSPEDLKGKILIKVYWNTYFCGLSIPLDTLAYPWIPDL